MDDYLVTEAEKAIKNVFQDAALSKEETRRRLESLADYINVLIGAL